jgi:hypothetical protein
MKLSSSTVKKLKNKLKTSTGGLSYLMADPKEFTLADIYMYGYYYPYEPTYLEENWVQYIHYVILFILEADKQGDF